MLLVWFLWWSRGHCYCCVLFTMATYHLLLQLFMVDMGHSLLSLSLYVGQVICCCSTFSLWPSVSCCYLLLVVMHTAVPLFCIYGGHVNFAAAVYCLWRSCDLWYSDTAILCLRWPRNIYSFSYFYGGHMAAEFIIKLTYKINALCGKI